MIRAFHMRFEIRRLLLLAPVAMLVAAGCTSNPATGRSQLLLLSSEQSIALGEQSSPALIAEYGGEVPSPDLQSYVDVVGGSIVQGTEANYAQLPWEFTVLDSDVVNAFALPGGKIFASRGLLVELDNEAQMAAVLGHEVGHVTAEHVNERVSHSMLIQGISIGTAVAAGQSESDWAKVVPIVVGLGGQGYLLRFNRKQELEADTLGVRYMTRAGYDPEAMLELLDVLEAQSAGPRQPEFLSTHPYPESRIADVNKLLAGPYAYTRGNPDFAKFQDRYRRQALPYLGTAQASVTGPAWCGVCRGHDLVSAAPPDTSHMP